ncbi:hypothetical protein F5Y17DRAFT_336719 [Xylariaceae sp. FL0594]|nr:hypothetical protein F5Y17DRAFT_336719 [Xylariaceae sp. FL0594]
MEMTIDLLIIGAGWTSTFLIPLLEREGIKHAATTTDGRDGTIPFKFDPASEDPAPFERLPDARTVLITFPLKGRGESKRFLSLWHATHNNNKGCSSSSSSTSSAKEKTTHFIQLGVTSIWPASKDEEGEEDPGWQDETSPYDKSSARAIAEDELIEESSSASYHHHYSAAVLSLAGLYGGARQPRDWLTRVVKAKADLASKGALHVVHGEDVARAVVALHRHFTPGKRWLLSDTRVYDWWDLAQDWASAAVKQKEEEGGGGCATTGLGAGQNQMSAERLAQHEEILKWVGELMLEKNVRALPRDTSSLGRRLDGRGFWKHMGIWPSQGRIR